MKIIKIKTEAIAHLSYLLIDGSEAAVVDPRRDCEVYVQKAEKNGAKIKYIFETHRNEDLVTGSRELKRHTGAEIYHGKDLDFEFGESVKDSQSFEVGNCVLRVLETPGHTPESISIAVYPNKDCKEAVGVFTGDALFVDDVGRTDFFEDQLEEYAAKLFDSIHKKLLPLGDQTILYPAHGAGSVCGGGIADREISSLGYEKAHNPRLKLSRDEFIKFKVNEKHQMPPYFKEMERVNLKGDDDPLKNYKRLDFITPSDLEKNFKKWQVIDVRSVESFVGCHIPDSLSIPTSMLGAYAGYFLEYKKEMALIADNLEQAAKAKKELTRLGFDKIHGMLKGGVASWETSGLPLRSLGLYDVDDILGLKKDGKVTLLDVRKPDEWESGIIPEARTLFLGDLPSNMSEFDKGKPIITYCGSGKRATIAASLLARGGVKDVSVFMGSMKAYNEKKKNG